MIWVDHLLVGAIIFVEPLQGVWFVSRLTRQIASGDSGARIRLYRLTVVMQWAWTIGLLALWTWMDRPYVWLGLTAPSGGRAWITAALCGVTLALYALQIRSLLTSPDARAMVRAQLAQSGPGVQAVIPATATELKRFLSVGLTAGVCEEIWARGFLLWYFTALLPWWAAIAAVIAAFGVGHAYQGLRGVLITAAAGAIFLAAYLSTGSLVAPIVMHAAVDVSNGYMGYRARRSDGELAVA
jgi:membrane protease YdiL (CAAX protease family)